MKLSDRAKKHLAASEEALKKAKGILDLVGDNGFSAEQSKEVDALLAQAEKDKAEADRLNRLSALDAFHNEPQRPGPAGAGASGGRIEVGRDNTEGRPFRGVREFLMAVMRAGQGQRVPELEPLRAAAGSDEQSRFSDPEGGFLVPEEFSPTLLQITPEPDPIGGRTTQIPMGSPVVNTRARVDKDHRTSVSGGLIVTRRPESAAAVESRFKLEMVKLEAFSLFGLSFVTEELLSDSPISIPALLTAGFRDQFVSHMIRERLNGTGVGEYLGVMNGPCLISVAKEGGQAADSVVYLNIVKMRSRCYGYGKAVWLYNHDCLPQLMSMVDPGNRLVWQPSARDGEPDRLLGRPAIATEYCRTVGDLGDIVLGNWSEYLEGTLTRGVESAVSVHVRFVNHERAFKFWLRNAGAPWWRDTLIPENGATLSPFVALEARA